MILLVALTGAPFACIAGEGVNRFVIIGFPPPDRPWSGADYETAARLLGTKGTPAPTLDGGDGGQVFSRMVDLENLRPVQEAPSALSARVNDSLLRHRAIGLIFKRYSAELIDGAPMRRELSRIIVLMIHSAQVLNDAMDELVPTLPRDDKFEAQMASVAQVKRGVEVIYSAMEVGIGEDAGFSPEDRSMLLKSMCECLPRLRSAMSASFRTELAGKLRARAAGFASQQDAAMLRGMIADLEHLDATVGG